MSPIGIVLLAILVLILIGGVGAPYIGNPWPNGYGFGWGGNRRDRRRPRHHPHPRSC